jgi:hypothetical protein
MATAATQRATKPKPPNYSEVLDVIRSVTAESDMWHLSDTVLRIVPTGITGLRDIVDAASSQGILGKLSVDTLRAYRATAEHWPADKRMDGVSFSAHREAERLNAGLTAERQLLTNVAKANGGKITVDAVRAAVRAKQGKQARQRPPRAGAAPAAAPGPKGPDAALADLKDGGKQLIAAIDKNTSNADLDKLRKGTSNVLGHIENLKMKRANARKSPAPTASAPKKKVAPTPSNGNGAKKPVKAGNLRGL